jgi:hypothetical protein
MKIKDFIEWLETQDTDLEVMVVSYQPESYHTYTDLDVRCGGHIEIIENCLFLGGDGEY